MTRIRWSTPVGQLEARVAEAEALRVHAPRLAGWYNEPYNRVMLSNSGELTPSEVVEAAGEVAAAGGYPFLLFREGELVGDGDFRHVSARAAEFAIMIGPRTLQGLGLGTRFSLLLHAFAFQRLELEVCYLAIVPANVAGQRCYEKVGYRVDSSEAARAYAEAADDITMSLGRETFAALHAGALAEIQVED